jgi:hypothetical protein
MRWENDIARGCSYCNTWINYGSDEDNALMDKLKKQSGLTDWDGKEAHRLLKLLYLKKISIEEFKELFTKAGMDYNQVEHCGGCSGCYNEKEIDLGNCHYGYSHACPDFNHENDGGHKCKIHDCISTWFCCVCGIGNCEMNDGEGLYGFPVSDREEDLMSCERHYNHPITREIEEKYYEDNNEAKEVIIITTDRLYHEVIKVLRKEDTAIQKRKTWDWKKRGK